MAYAYANWITTSEPVARLAALRNHIAEVSAQMGPDVASLGHSRSAGSLSIYLDKLMEREKELAAAVGASAAGGGVLLTSFERQES